MISPRNDGGLTWVEVLVLLAVAGVLVMLMIPRVGCGPVRYEGAEALNRMRQLFIATSTMAGDGSLGWPGDLEGGSFSNWARTLVERGYLSTNDLCKLLSGPGKKVRGMPSDVHECAVLVYAVREDSATNAVFLTSANFTNTPQGGKALEADARPYGNKLFVVFRKDGVGMILGKKQVGETNVIGSYVPLCR